MTASDPEIHIANLERELRWAQLKIQSLEERWRQHLIKLFGPKSETLSSLQLELLAEEEPSATRDEVEAEARREPITRTSPRKPHPGRSYVWSLPLPAFGEIWNQRAPVVMPAPGRSGL
jgi:hypothetical protein